MTRFVIILAVCCIFAGWWGIPLAFLIQIIITPAVPDGPPWKKDPLFKKD
jgi:hypothetical protein